MKIKVFTIFPEMLRPMLSESILGRAIDAGYLEVELIDIRPYADNRHKNTDDYPFGGGAGMVMLAQPIVDAFADNTPPDFHGKRIYMSPRGRRLNQKIVEELSIGDYVLTGGELAALVVIDAVSRLIPGVLGSDESAGDESFTTGLLEYPQYTRPRDFRGMEAPEVLLSGHHANILKWQREQALKITLQNRPDLLETAPLTGKDREYLALLQVEKEENEAIEK